MSSLERANYFLLNICAKLSRMFDLLATEVFYVLLRRGDFRLIGYFKYFRSGDFFIPFLFGTWDP